MKLSRDGIKVADNWRQMGIELPQFDRQHMIALTLERPRWVHFGAGNIFRAFIAMLQQELLNSGEVDTGVIAVEGFDYEIIDKIYAPHDNLSLLVITNSDGNFEKKVIGSVSESLIGDPSKKGDWERLNAIFSNPSLQMVSFTITEKGYNLKSNSGKYLPDVEKDILEGPKHPRNIIAKVASLAYTRYKNGKLPVAFVSMDNCSGNGKRLHDAVEAIAREWVERELVEKGFLEYINNPEKVTFPWSMIDKIVPRPSEEVKKALNQIGFMDTQIVCTDKNTFIAPFVNAEKPQYLVVEDNFPNGRPPLEKAGVLFADRSTVEKAEKMKVCTCLNPLHTSLAVFGCLLGYNLISEEMRDPHLKRLVEKVGYEEGRPVVADPGILDPEKFIKEVIEERLPNPYIPDTPQRIATDTSQKIGIRFGETIKAYCERPDLDVRKLKYIPLVIAGWCRYLMGIDDRGNEMALSPDPLLDTLRACVANIRLGSNISPCDSLKPILSNEGIFGLDLYSVGLGEKIEGYFNDMISGVGAVRRALQKHLGVDVNQ
ncbi:mannitol dehydrogenase family protein [Caldanaerobius polysaccharolyticus]|nr:mannitol dehydrogenase family protein [Caldanaerobius polysaccharolyticus]